MFIRFDNYMINLKMIEVIIYEEDIIFIGMNSGESLHLDLKHAGRLEKALHGFNAKNGGL